MSNNTKLKGMVLLQRFSGELFLWNEKEYETYLLENPNEKHQHKLLYKFTDSPSTCAGTWVRASERVPNHYRSVFARYTHDGKRCAWTIRYNPSMGHWITQGDEGIVDATDLEWLEENPHPGT